MLTFTLPFVRVFFLVYLYHVISHVSTLSKHIFMFFISFANPLFKCYTNTLYVNIYQVSHKTLYIVVLYSSILLDLMILLNPQTHSHP